MRPPAPGGPLSFAADGHTTGHSVPLRRFPLIQCQLVVSTLWGIFYYKEIAAPRAVALSLAASAVLLLGVLLLSGAKT